MGFLARLRARLISLLSPAEPREQIQPAPALPQPEPAPPAPPLAPPQPRRDRERRRLAQAEERAAAAEERARKAEQKLKEAEARAAAAEERARQSGQRLKQLDAHAKRVPQESRREERRARRSEAQVKEAEARIRAAEERALAAERRARDAEEDALRARDAMERERQLTARVKELEARLEDASGRAALPDGAPAVEVAFSPGDACLDAIRAQITRARRSIDACVFTITDDRIASALLDAHRRGVKVRVITDNDKSFDEGSDVDRLARAGIPVRKDLTEYHMHHKFAVFDGRVTLTGSYNWTRSAARHNEENLIVSGDPRLCAPFAQEFEELWRKLGPGRDGSQ